MELLWYLLKIPLACLHGRALSARSQNFQQTHNLLIFRLCGNTRGYKKYKLKVFSKFPQVTSMITVNKAAFYA